MAGLFISFEGVDGVGKTTQVGRLRDYALSLGYDVVVTREPGGTPLGRALRQLLLHGVSSGADDAAAAAPPPAPGLKPSQSPRWGRRFRRPFGVKMLRNYLSNAAKAAVAFAKPSA